MTMTMSERLVARMTGRGQRSGPSRRGFLGGAALVGAALAVDPWGYLVRPAHAYDAVCGAAAGCADGYSVFCCTINGGNNSCPPNSFIGGWWKADNASLCGGSARYYIDCNAFLGGPWQCRCAEGTCDQRRVACNQFRYGQCSLDIPAAQSGPVVCRMVSCTPPWQQFGGVCTSSSATDNKTVTHSAPCVGSRTPVGSVDEVTDAGNAIRIRGWALDGDEPYTEIPVAVYIDNVGIGWFPTGVGRPDVNAALGVPGNHGFDLTIPIRPGQHSVIVFAINVGSANNPIIGGGPVLVGASPIGHLDEVIPLTNGIRLRGWAFDPDQSATEIPVAVYLDGGGINWFPTGRPRADVNSVFGVGGNHGFDITITSPPGSHEVTVYAINVAGGAGNPLVGQQRTTVGSLPRGTLDQLTASGNTVRLRGWAYDPDNPTAEISVAIYRDDAGINWFPTGKVRPDVNSVFRIGGNHGFDISLPGTPSGRHTFAVYAINIGPDGGNPLIANTAVQVP